MSTPSIQKQIEDAYNNYYNFDMGQKKTDQKNFDAKLGIFKGLSQNPAFILMMFFTTILAANNVPHGPFAGNSASYSRNQEDQLTEVAKELNYASAFRNAVSDIKEKVEDAKTKDDPNAIKDIENDIKFMKQYLSNKSKTNPDGVTKFNPDAPQIFENSEQTFMKSFDQIYTGDPKNPGFLDEINSKFHGSIHAAWEAAEKQGDKVAGGLFQSFTNATDTLFSSVGVQQNVLNTRLQDVESNYKSTLAVVTQGMKSFFSVITNALQKMTTS